MKLNDFVPAHANYHRIKVYDAQNDRNKLYEGNPIGAVQLYGDCSVENFEFGDTSVKIEIKVDEDSCF